MEKNHFRNSIRKKSCGNHTGASHRRCREMSRNSSKSCPGPDRGPRLRKGLRRELLRGRGCSPPAEGHTRTPYLTRGVVAAVILPPGPLLGRPVVAKCREMSPNHPGGPLTAESPFWTGIWWQKHRGGPPGATQGVTGRRGATGVVWRSALAAVAQLGVSRNVAKYLRTT